MRAANALACLVSLCLPPAAAARGAAMAGVWQDCLREGVHGGPPAELKAPPEGRVVVELAPSCPAAFDLEAELCWMPPPGGRGGGAELLVGPHAFGSGGYQVAAADGTWGVAECRIPRWQPEQWQSVEVRLRPQWVEYWLAGRLVVRSPAHSGASTTGVRLGLSGGARALLRRCRLRAAPGEAAQPPAARFVYPAPLSRCEGRPVPDGLAAGGVAMEVLGAGRHKPLLGGQDATLGAGGHYVATFGLRGAEGAGQVWAEVACAGGHTLASASALLEELPTDRYARLRVPFRCEAGAVLEFRLAAERGRLRVDEVAVESAGEATSGGLASGPRTAAGERQASAGGPPRPRRALPLADVWARAPKNVGRGLFILALDRRLTEGGAYEFRVRWQQDAAPRQDGLALDLWVACRDAWGIVRVLDHGVAWDSVPRGPRETAAWLGPAAIARYGPPVAFLAVLYSRGAPVAAACRKWGVPVDDVYILGAQRAGALRGGGPTE